ncbi:putative ABC transport system permease protein [Catalinimonas alkaloidigena]|uniref:Putative ABC transport system permease protein n=1 Tax=Catalinimonas alkaloidigena TaxID=1075417 RepID=A0A1G8YHJ3_9BACT|nr:FtsX-like permease family protein [Catalinimonas alkaloidigena]SDK02171.1 putative ABC transport system permease protein [Catalinimonas alkaloidigena]
MKQRDALPPHGADRLLERFGAPDAEEVLGDLHELYGTWERRYGWRKARWRYWQQTLRFSVRFAFRKNHTSRFSNSAVMFKNYLKVGLRNLLKYKAFSFINVFGLATATSVCLLIILMLADQKSYDRFHTQSDRIYRIISDPPDTRAPYATTPAPVADALAHTFPMVETATLLTPGVEGDLIYNQRLVQLKGYFADTAFFEVFSFPLAEGSPQSALTEPNALVITRTLAEQLFPHEDPLGKSVDFLGDSLGHAGFAWGPFTITGIIDDGAYKSHLKFDVLLSAATLPTLYARDYRTDLTQDWANYFQCATYALLYPDRRQDEMETALHALAARQYADLKDREGFQLAVQPLLAITPGPALGNSPVSLPLVAYYVLGGLAGVIMLLACLNYTNLSVARALTRTKEIGVRKVTGARRLDLVYQFLSESILTALLALVLAVLLLVFLKSAFMNLWVNQFLNFDLRENVPVYVLFVGFALLIGVFAGVYPALRLSAYRPIKVLKQHEGDRPGKLGLRKVVSVSQFVVSLLFIVASLLIYNQFRYYMAFDYGFASEQIVNVPLQGNEYPRVAAQLGAVPGIAQLSASEYIPATGTNNGASLRKADSDDDYTYLISLPTDEHFTENLGIALIAGRNLPPTGPSSERFIVVNEAAVRAFGFARPEEMLGLTLDNEWSDQDLEVIGVVADFRVDLPISQRAKETRPMFLCNQPDRFRYAQVKLASPDLTGTLAELETAWKKVDPLHPFQYEFYDQQLADTHQAVLDVVRIVGFLAFLAITIACLGLLGMALYTTERRTKEIGIRKVLGAESFRLALLLSKGFLAILALSVLIGAPLSYFLNNLWLQSFPNRVEFGPGTVFLGSLVLLVLGLLTIGSQTLRAARQNPVNTLKSE